MASDLMCQDVIDRSFPARHRHRENETSLSLSCTLFSLSRLLYFCLERKAVGSLLVSYAYMHVVVRQFYPSHGKLGESYTLVHSRVAGMMTFRLRISVSHPRILARPVRTHHGGGVWLWEADFGALQQRTVVESGKIGVEFFVIIAHISVSSQINIKLRSVLRHSDQKVSDVHLLVSMRGGLLLSRGWTPFWRRIFCFFV
mmetsp:Transcript_16656/g.28240  ORF Transcript_16656/g.28240 Transcript_16656/m.28240 type:complete len:200 (-) Transcript_16656:41-640(-)